MPTTQLLQAIESSLAKINAEKTLWVAYSGGLDSHVLLHLLASLRKKYSLDLRAIHINHGIQSSAEQWAEHCWHSCEALKIPCTIIAVDAKAQKGQSMEMQAREKRYHVFSSLLAASDTLLTAHHQEDQAETVLLRLCRGTGITGLAAMKSLSQLGEGYLLRPLLDCSKQALQEYAEKYGLKWIEDPSNTDLNMQRNFLRHQIIPELEQQWPAVVKILARAASNCAEAIEIIEECAAADYLKAQGSVSGTLSVNALRQLSSARCNQAIRYWLTQQKLVLPTQAQLSALRCEMLSAKEDAEPLLAWSEVEVRRYAGDLYAMNCLESSRKASLTASCQLETPVIPAELARAGIQEQIDGKITLDLTRYSQPWGLEKPFELPNNLGSLKAEKRLGQGIILSTEQRGQITVKFRRGGERLQPAGRQGSHPLKKLFQEWTVPPWLRYCTPLIYWQDQIVAVPGYCVAEGFAVLKKEWGFVFY